MTLTDYTSTDKGPPEWIEADQVVSVQGHVEEDVVVELKLVPSDRYDDLQFELIRDGLPIPSDRYRLSMRGNIVQLALKQTRKNDAGYYSLVATRLGQEKDKGAVKKIHVSIDEASYEEGDPPVFLRRLSDLAVKVGTRTRFLVEIRSVTTPKITWYKNDAAIHEGPRFSLVHEGNFHCVDVVPVTVEDQGCWTCMAENRSGRSSCTSNLTVVVPKAYKKPEFIEELRALLTETGTVSLECKVVGVPTPVLRWFKDEKEIKAGDVFALTANPDDPTSLGVYTCEAINCMGTAYSSSKVHVVGRGSREGSLKPADALTPSGPLPIFKQSLQDECCRIGDTLVLFCRVQVPPWPKAIAWYNKGGRVEPSEKYHVIEDGIGGYSVEVKQTEAMDEGEWKCVATSDDSMKQFTSCYVAMSIPRNYRKPRFMENLKAVLTEEGLVSFECKVVGFPTPLLRWFKDGQELKPGDVYQLTGTNSLGSYCCIARNCMGEAKSTAELTIEDIQNQLNEEERFQLLSVNQPPKFIKGLRSCEARINEDFRFTVQVSVAPEPSLSWYRDDAIVDESEKYQLARENLGTCHLDVQKLEFIDQAEWKCVAANDFGHSVTSCFLKLIIPKHYKKPKFLESLRAILSEEGAVNLECKVIGVPQPVLKWYKDNVELKPGDIHRIISGQDGTCCLGTYTCEATNCMGTVSSSASLLGFEERKNAKEVQSPNGHELARNLSLSTIHEERTSQLYDTPQTDHSVTLDERGEVSFSFDGKEVSVSLYETPDLTEEEALQIVEMYADQLSEHVTEHNVIELPPMRFVKETSTSGNLLMEAVVIDVSPDYFVSAEDGDDLRTEADFEDVSIMDDPTHVLSSPERDSRGSLKRSALSIADEDEKAPSRPPRKKSTSVSSTKSERSQRIESDSFHSAQKDEPPLSPLSSLKQDDSDTFADALSSAHLSVTESLIQKQVEHGAADNRKRSLSAEKTNGSSLDDGIGGDSSLGDSATGVPRRKKQCKKKQRQDKSSSEEYSCPSDYEGRKGSEPEDKIDTKTEQRQPVECIDKTRTDIGSEAERKAVKTLSTEEGPLDDLGGVKDTIPGVSGSADNVDILEKVRGPIEDVLLESRTALREALRACENAPDDSASRSSDVRRRIDDVYRKLEVSQGKGADIEVLIDLETPLRALLKAIGDITSAQSTEFVRRILEPSVAQLSRAVENLDLPSLQPTLAILRKVDDRIHNVPNGTEGLSSTRSISEASQTITEEIVDTLIGVQSAFNTILSYVEGSKPAMNGAAGSQQALTVSGFAACLAELKECVSHTAHIAMTSKENEMLNSLMEFREPLLDLQLALVSEERTSRELSIMKEATSAVDSLKDVVAMMLERSENPEAASRARIILKILEDTDEQMSKLTKRLSEVEKDAQRHVLKNLNVDQSLSGVHFGLSSVLEKQENHVVSCRLIECIETLRQTIGSSAIAIANLRDPIDDEIIREIGGLNESLLNLQRNLLTEKHEPGEEEILNSLAGPMSALKKIIRSVIDSSSSVEPIVTMLGLLEEIEKDIPLIAKEISKRKSQAESIAKSRGDAEKVNELKSVLAGRISRSLDPIKYWLSTTPEDSTKTEMESALSSTIEELKRNVNQIAIQSSYSEPPSDKSLIEALIDLREPLMRLKNAISVYHEPEDLSILEGLDYPMKHLLQTIMNVLREHAEEESLRPVVDIVEQIKDQISFSIKEALYRQEVKQFDKTSILETEQEEAVTVSRETIPGTLTEIASTPLETWTAPLPTEQATTEDNSKRISDDAVVMDDASQTVRGEQQEREEKASKLIVSLSETLEKLQLEMTGILEDFEESATVTATVPHSKLANSLEELRRTVSTIRVMTTVYGEEIGTSEEKVNQATLVLTNLLQPLTNIRKLFSREHEHDISELMILNRLTPLLDVIESDVIQRSIGFVGKGGDTEKEFESLLCVLEEIKIEVPLVIEEVSSKRKTLECLRDISKPLESILERMSDLEKAAEETLETDVASILGKPTAVLLRDIKIAAQELQTLDKRGPVILELRNLLEPLLEFHSCLSMVQNIRRSLVPDDSLLEERRSVILRAVDGLQQQVYRTVETIANMEESSLFNESLTQLNLAILQVQKQIGKTDYSRRSSSTNISLQDRLSSTLNRLAGTIMTLQVNPDKDTYGIVSKSLEKLQKQISLAQMQFVQTGGQLIDEEAIVEGFLYPANQLLSTFNVLEENTRQAAPSTISRDSINQLRELADSISELSSSLSAHRTELVRDGTSKTAPIVETFSAVIDVLDLVKDSITTIEKTIPVEGEKQSMIITKVDNVTDEVIEVSQEEIETMMTITEILPSKTVTEEVVQLQIEDTSTMAQTADSENLKILSIEQTQDNLADVTECEENQEVQKLEEHVETASQISKLNAKMRNLEQPLRELIDFTTSATQESLVSKSEEDKRKIRELTALTQVLYDLQATNASIKTALSSSSVVPLASQFRRMEDILADLERATGTVISLTREGVRPELKENIVASLQTFVEPLDALENVFASVCQTIEEDNYVDGESLIAMAKVLMPCISDTVKCLNAIRVSKCVIIIDEKETETTKTKEEAKDIEETTARPLEELIEAIMDSQEQVKCDKSSPSESKSPSTEPTVESKTMENVIATKTETKLNKALVEEVDSSATKIVTPIADADAETSQQTLSSSLTPSPIEELPVEEKAATPKSIAESVEEVNARSPSKIDQPKVEAIQLSEKDVMQGEQEKAETLQAIISPLQELRKSLDEICEVETAKLDEKTVAVSDLTEPLLNLELMLNREIQQVVSSPSEETEEIKHDEVTPQKLSVTSVLEELQKSIATIHEQVQLNTVTDVGSDETPKIRLMQAVEKPLEELKMSIACIQTDSSVCQQMEELSSAEQIAVLQTVAKSVEEFGERFTSIVDQLKIETESTPQINIQQEEQKLDPDVLRKIVDPIHVLRETLSKIEDLQNAKIEFSEISKQKREIVQLSEVMHPLEKLEQSLNASVQQVTVMQENITEEFSENRVSLANADLKPVLEELKNSIVIVQQQAAHNEDTAVAKTLNEAFECLKAPLTAVEEIVDRFDETTESGKVSALLTFAKSVEETANRLVAVANQQMTQQDIQKTSLLRTITIPIEGLQSAILKLEDRVSQTLEVKETIKAVALECMLQPLQQLQQSLLTASHREAVLSLQRLPIKPILDDLSKFVATIQDQITIAQDKLSFVEANADDLAALRDFARSLGDLRTSTVVLQQLNAIENAGQQIVEIENASALQAFAKSIEEFRKCCSVVTERPRIVDAFTTNTQLERSTRVDTQLLENIIAPLRILQEQILTIDETKMQQSETLDVTEAKKPVTMLSSLIGPLQQLEKSFVATVQKVHVIEHEECSLTPEPSLVNLEKLALQPILEEVQQSIASVQEQVILEAGSHVTSETETSALLKSIAQPLVDLRASVASVQQATGLAPDPLNELAQQQNVSALETFAETLHSLAERIAMCNHQQIIMEPAADTISEDVSSLNTWADVIEEPLSKITCPMVIDQGTIESPAEIAMSISEDEDSALKTLAKPLTELRECLALIVEERKVVAPSDVACSLPQSKDMSVLKTMIQPLLELKDAAALIIQEQMAVERASEHSFAIEGNSESVLRPWIEPLEELRHSIAVIQDQILVETPVDRPKDDTVLSTLAEPLFDLQRAISVLETRVMSPDVESILGDTSSSWITECLAIPLHEIEKSIADIRQCTVMEPVTVIVEEQAKALSPDWSIVEKLTKPMEDIQSVILRIEGDSTETAALKAMVNPLANLQENLTLLKNKSHLSAVDEEGSTDAIVESLASLEKCITFVEGKIKDKPLAERSSMTEIDISVSNVLVSPLIELKRAIITVEESPSVYFKNLERPLGLVQEALETVLSTQRREKLSNLSTKLTNTISNISESIESIGRRLEEQDAPVVLEIHIECEALRMLANPLQNIKKCIKQIQEEPCSADSMTSALQNLEKSITVMREQSADKPLTESHHTNFDAMIGLSKNLIPCLHELQESTETSKTLWHEKTVLEGLTILERPLSKLRTVINIIDDQFLKGEITWIVEKDKVESQKKTVKTKMQESENETAVEKDDKSMKIVEIEEMKDKDSVSDINDKENKERPEERKEEEEQKKQEDKELVRKETEQYKADKNKKEKEEGKKEEAIEKAQKIKEEETKKKENGKIEKETEQSEKSIQDEKKQKDEIERKETEKSKSLRKQEKDEEIKQLKKEETDVIEEKKSKEVAETEEMKKDVQKDTEDQEKLKMIESERKEKTSQETKESNGIKKVEEDLNVKAKEAENEKRKEIENTKKEEEQPKEKKEPEEIEKAKTNENDTKEDDGIKLAEQHKKNEIEKIEMEERSQEKGKETNETIKKEQEVVKAEETKMLQKEEDSRNNEAKTNEIKEEKDKVMKEDEKTVKEPEDLRNKDNDALRQNKDVQKDEEINRLKKQEEQKQEEKRLEGEKEKKTEQEKEKATGQVKDKEDKKIKEEKVEKLEKKKEKSKKKQGDETKAEKMKEEGQKEKDVAEKHEKQKATDDMKVEECEKAKDEKVAEPEEKEKESNKQEEAAQMKINKIKEEEEKKKDEIEEQKGEDIEKVKEKEKIKDEKAEEVTKSKEQSSRTEKTAQEKMKEEGEKKEDERKKQKSEEVIEKMKGEKDGKAKNKKPEKLEEEKQDTSKKDEVAQIKEEEQRKKEKDDRSKEKNEEQKEQIQIEKTKIAEDEQAIMKADVGEKKAIQKKSKKENEKVEAASKEQEKIEESSRKEEEILQTQSKYTSNAEKVDDKNESERQYKEANENRKQEKKASVKQKQEGELDKKTHEIQSTEDKDVHLKVVEDRKMQRDDRVLERQEELKRPQYDKSWLCTKEEERVSRSDEHEIQKEVDDSQKRHDDTSRALQRIETECLERRKTAGRFERKLVDYTFGSDEEMLQRRNDEKRIRRDETARLLREEEQRLRRRREEEITRNKQRREEQIREDEWSRRRENETDRFLRNMLDSRCRLEKSLAMSFDSDYLRDKREYASRFDSGMPTTLSSTSKSYSWRDSLASLNRKRIDDYWDYKLRDFSMDKYSLDAGSSYYRRRRKREDRIFRARSIGLLKYEDYSSGESDARAWPTRRAKTETIPRISFDNYGSGSSNYIGLGQTEGPPMWDKPKKPSFCTRLTNRVVGVGMRTRLTCTVLGNPEPRVYWTKDDQRLDASSSRCRTRFENGMAYLELHDALPEDAGVYACLAENAHGTSTTESALKVYSDYKPTCSPPIFARSIKDTYRYSDRKLILECRVRAHPPPTVSWLKDGETLRGERYKPIYLDDDVYRLEIADPDFSDNGQYTCRAVNDLRTEEISHMVHVDDREWRPASRTDRSLGDESASEVARRPRFSNLLKDYSVPAGGTIALQVEVKGVPVPEVKWLRGDRNEPVAIPKARTFVERGLHTLIVPEATESERGTYVCRAINAYGQVDTSVTVDVISTSAIDGGKPAEFVSRPVRKSIDVTIGEDISVSFRVGGIPKPRVTWMKGLTDITDGPRSYKESIDDYVRLTLKRAIPSDEGTYCILVKNRYGCDRCFFSIKVKQRARSLTPSPDWNSLTEREAVEERDDDMSYVRNVPGPISSEPVVIDGGKNWLSLSWGKAERRGPAPVIAYKVEAWLLGGEGGARWMELGITPINAFDAFNLRPGGEYKFRVTPRNRYGWGESVTMVSSSVVSDSTDLPEFTKILPGQLKALEGTPVKLECEIRGDPKMEVRWYRETTEIDPRSDSRFAIYHAGLKSTLTIADVKEDDSGRYVCEASNRIGKVSSFARVLVVNDLRIIEADEKLRTSFSVEPEDRPPQFSMRIRDRRVQTTYPVRLTCQVIGHPVPEITWYKNGTEIIQDDRHVFWDDDSNFHTLEIIHSTLDDSGSYMVTARNINGSVSCRCTLVVDKGIRAYIAPEFLRDLDAAYTIRPGDELRMSAQLEAYPSVGVVWHRDGIRLRPSRRAAMTLSHDGTVQFSLANATARDAGVYSCTATNAVGHTETSTRVAVIAAQDQDRPSVDGLSGVTSVSPDIPYSKEPLFVTKPLSTEAVEGDPVIILCEVVGDPKPEVMWLRDFLKPDYYRDAPHFRLVGEGPQYRLEIPYAKLDFTGTYSVIARNCHGEAKAVISLQIYAKGQGKEDQTQKSPHGKVLTLPIVKRELRDLRCCDGDAVSLECKVHAAPEPPFVRWERGGKIVAMADDFAAEFDGETARLSIQHVYPEDEGEYTCVAYNDLGKAYTSACLVVDVPEGKENTLSQRLTRPMGLLSAGSTPRSTPRSTPIRSLSPAVSHGRELRSPQVLPRRTASRRPRVCPPKFYAVPHNRLVQEGETVRFQCAVVGHPAPWVRWDKNGSVVTPSARITVKERDDVKILEIADVMREDAALYRVTAENDYGRIEASARLEVISRYESTGRTVRIRSASPRTYPSFDRSLLPTIGRINGRLQLECRVRGTPSVTPTWYRNGRPLERSARIRRHYDGAIVKIEITKVKASDAGEYTCVATNVLGSTRNSCQVTVLHPHDSSDADKRAPRFLRALPPESIVMENHRYELQAGVAGTPPLTITWSKDGRELPDNDYYKHVVYGDGGIALRLPEVRPQDAGEYTCMVRNSFGVASCNGLFAVQDYKDVPELAPQFTKTPLSVIAARGSTACFCARVQSGRSTEVIWTINGRDVRQNAKCKVERDGDVSILRVRDVSSRDTGEIRCTASTSGKGPSVSCVAKLRLLRSQCDLDVPVTKLEDDESSPVESSRMSTDLADEPENVARPLLSLSERRRGRGRSPTRARSSSFPRRTTAIYDEHVSPLPTKKRIFSDASDDPRKSRREQDASRPAENDLDDKVADTNDRNLLSSSNKNADDGLPRSLSLRKTEQPHHRHTDVTEYHVNDFIYYSESLGASSSDEGNDKSIIDGAPCDERQTTSYERDANVEDAEPRLEPTKATIVDGPSDVTVFRGARAAVRITYRGLPEPTVKWLRVNRVVQPDGKIGIISGCGSSRLTLDDITYDHAGKYEVSVENTLGKERRFFSLAVEGPPEPPIDRPSVNVAEGRATIAWRSSPYDGGRTVLGYTVEAKRAGDSTWTVIAKSCHSLSQTVPSAGTSSVAPGETYRFRVRAGNIHGLGEPGMESDPVRIPRQGETMFQEEEEDEFEPSFEARMVEPEEGRLFGERYDVLEELGKGRYGVVKKVIERESGTCLAAKFVRTIKAKDREQVREEIRIMNALRHPKLLLLAAAYESPRETVMVTEYISGGELFERVVADDFTLTERDSILFMRQICEGVEYMHENKIVHLDLKPENIMCRTRTSHQIKLIDFGLAQTLKPDTPVRVLFGTPEFIPPEIIGYEPIGTESDMWSVGVICYVLLTGLSPFMGDNDAETFANITRADYDLEDEAFDAISDDAKDFITGLLIKRKELRMSAAQCLKHPWMAQHAAAMRRIVLPTEKLKKFIIRRKWQKTGNAIRALGRMAILSAYNRRSPTTTAESSPMSEQHFEAIDARRLDDELRSVQEVKSDDYVNGDGEGTNAEQSFIEAESQGGSHSWLRVAEENMETQKHMLIDNIEQKIILDPDRTEKKTMKASNHKSDSEDELENVGAAAGEEPSTMDESVLNSSLKWINAERETPEADAKVMLKTKSALQRVTTHLEIFLSDENKSSGVKSIERSSEAERHATPMSHTSRTVFRGDSRDSGIGDCQLTSPLQVDELGIVSTIEEEADFELSNRAIPKAASDNTSKNRQISTADILTGPERDKEVTLCGTDNIQTDGKVATKSAVTKASCEINPERRVADEDTDARILIGRNHGKFLPTGNVSRTARIFERETTRSKDSQAPVTQRAYPPIIVAGKPYTERIQKAFAFWNK